MPIQSSWDTQAEQTIEVQVKSTLPVVTDVPNDDKPEGRTPPRSTSRTGSSKRGRQGAWKEATGPPETVSGFKSNRVPGKSGLNRWKAHVGTPSVDSSAALKSILGVGAVQANQKVAPA